MSPFTRWTIRCVFFAGVTFILMASGIFGQVSDDLKVPVTNMLNYIPFGEPAPYPDRLDNTFFALYVLFNTLAGIVATVVAELLVKLARNNK